MKQIGVVIPGLLAGFKNDARFNGWRWHQDHLSGNKLVDEKGAPYPVLVQSLYCEKPSMTMFTITLMDDVLGLDSRISDCNHTLIATVSTETRQDFIEAVGQFIEVVQHCHIYDSEQVKEEELGRMTARLLTHEPIRSDNPIAGVLTHLGVLGSDPYIVGWEGVREKRPDMWILARRWNLIKPTGLPKMEDPSHAAFADCYKGLHKACRELGLSYSLEWAEDNKEWELVTGSSDDVPRANFQYADLGLVFFEAFNFLYAYLEKKYAA